MGYPIIIFQLSKKTFDKNLHILADVKKEIKNTTEFNKFLEKNKIANVLIISDNDSMKNINKSARNRFIDIKKAKYEASEILMTNYDLINFINNLENQGNIVFVTHYVVIAAIFGRAVTSGEILIADQNFNVVGRINDY